jgi:hypothetical protein
MTALGILLQVSAKWMMNLLDWAMGKYGLDPANHRETYA